MDRSEWHPQGVSHVASSVVLILAIQHIILYLEGSQDPDMMSEAIPRFEPFECCCMAILFCGRPREDDAPPVGTSPPPLLIKSDDRGNHPVAPSLCVRRVNAMIFLGRR